MTMVIAPERSDAELHDALAAHHRQVVAAHAVLLVDIGEHDRVVAWRRMGARNEEDYLVRYHQLAWPTAKDWVRQASVLARHPELAAAYAEATMSTDKLNAACRLAAARDVEADNSAAVTGGGRRRRPCRRAPSRRRSLPVRDRGSCRRRTRSSVP